MALTSASVLSLPSPPANCHRRLSDPLDNTPLPNNLPKTLQPQNNSLSILSLHLVYICPNSSASPNIPCPFTCPCLLPRVSLPSLFLKGMPSLAPPDIRYHQTLGLHPHMLWTGHHTSVWNFWLTGPHFFPTKWGSSPCDYFHYLLECLICCKL